MNENEKPAGDVAMPKVCTLCAVEVDADIGIMFPFVVVASSEGWVAELAGAFNVVKQSDALAALAAVTAERDTLAAQVEVLRKDAELLDWLADLSNPDGQVMLPGWAVEQNLGSMRDAIRSVMDAAKAEKS